jgi:hypothetical protein
VPMSASYLFTVTGNRRRPSAQASLLVLADA